MKGLIIMSDIEKRIQQMLIMQRKHPRRPHRPNGLKIKSTCINNKNVSKRRKNICLMNSDPID